jgi:three-Cys-motif partner protein
MIAHALSKTEITCMRATAMAPQQSPHDAALHRFGAKHTLIKLDAIERYLPAYTTALKNWSFTTHYIDAFAGTGVCHIKADGGRLMVPGSASIALACDPPFHKIVFIEQSRRKAQALERLKQAAPQRDIKIKRGDANEELPAYLATLSQLRDRAIVFLDPFGMELEWSTLVQIAQSRLTDLWYLFPLSGIYRQATIDAKDIDEDKAAALTRTLGTEEWRSAFYDQPPQASLFGPVSDVRTADVPEILSWVKGRLETIFPGVLRPKVIYHITESGKPGAPLFALFFAVSNPSPRARALALRIADGVLHG